MLNKIHVYEILQFYCGSDSLFYKKDNTFLDIVEDKDGNISDEDFITCVQQLGYQYKSNINEPHKAKKIRKKSDYLLLMTIFHFLRLIFGKKIKYLT